MIVVMMGRGLRGSEGDEKEADDCRLLQADNG